MSISELKYLFCKNQVREGTRVPYHVDVYLCKLSEEKNNSKYDLINQYIAKELPNNLSAILEKDEYTALLTKAKEGLLDPNKNYGDLYLYIQKFSHVVNKENLDENTMIATAKDLSDLIFFTELTTIERNNFIKLITFKQSYLKELIADILKDPETQKAINEFLNNLKKGLNLK